MWAGLFGCSGLTGLPSNIFRSSEVELLVDELDKAHAVSLSFCTQLSCDFPPVVAFTHSFTRPGLTIHYTIPV